MISQNLYRGRVFSENVREKQRTEFLAPPVLQSSHGRFNLIGESNIFSACVKYCGFDGIIYNSVHLEHCEPRNVALFKSDKISYVSNECHEYNISYRDKNNA